MDENFTSVALCRLYAIKRDVVEMSLRVHILHWPKRPISVSFGVTSTACLQLHLDFWLPIFIPGTKGVIS